MKNIFSVSMIAALLFTACNPSDNKSSAEKGSSLPTQKFKSDNGGHWKGTFTNGMKGNKISFDIEGDSLKELTFEGYWRCEGKLDLTTLGPEKSFVLQGNKVDGVIIEPENGHAPFRFELHGTINGNNAEGTLRISNVPAGCDTYKLNWIAEKE